MALRTYEYQTPEGFVVKLDLTNEGLEDESVVQDWEITCTPAPGYETSHVHTWPRHPGFEMLTTRWYPQERNI